MIDMTMNTAVGQSPIRWRDFSLFSHNSWLQAALILKKVSLFNAFGNAGEILINHTACPHIHMSNFGIADLPLG